MCKRNWRGAAVALMATAFIIPNAMAATLVVRVVSRDLPKADAALPGVAVNVRGVHATRSGNTGADGEVRFDVPDGSYSATAQTGNLAADTANGCVQGASPVTMMLVLRVRHPQTPSAKKAGDITARVISPGARGTTTLIRGERDIVAHAATDAAGTLVIPAIPWGNYTLNVVARGYLLRRLQFSHTPDAPSLGDIELYASCSRR